MDIKKLGAFDVIGLAIIWTAITIIAFAEPAATIFGFIPGYFLSAMIITKKPW